MQTMELTEMTTTSDELIAENTDVDDDLNNNESKTTDVPESVENEAVNEESEQSSNLQQNRTQRVPKKFIDKDGNVKVDELAKSYLALEPLINEKAQWTKEKQNLVEQLNRQSLIPPQTTQKALSFLQAGNYAKMLNESINPEETKVLLEKFKQNPTPELLSQIEDNFSKANVKKVAVTSQKELQLVNQKIFKQNLEQLKNHMDNFRNQTLEKYRSYFYNPAFCKLFNKAFELTGTNLDVASLVNMLDEYAKTKLLEFQLHKKRQDENADATSELTGMIPSSKAKKRETLPDVNLLEIEDKVLLKKYIQKYNKK